MRPTLVGDRWAVVAGHPLVSQVAAEVLVRGGNAIDAGVAAGLATNVVQVDMCSFGGIAPILVRPGGSAVAYDVAGVGRWGREATLEMVRNRYGGALPLGKAPHILPGAPSAWLTALERFGTWTFSEVVAPAIELAREGFTLDVRTAHTLDIMATGFGRWQSDREIFCPQGRPLRAGERLVQSDLAALLGSLANQEAAATASPGSGACMMPSTAASRRSAWQLSSPTTGASFSTADFADYRAEVTAAPVMDFAGRSLFSTGLSTQGLIALQTLGILERRGVLDPPHNESRYLHELVEAIKIGFSEREQFYGDPAFTHLRWEELVSGQRLDRLAELTSARAQSWSVTAPLAPLGSTTALVVTDADGNVFASSPSDTVDGGPIVDGLGILCSPRGVQSRLIAVHPNVIAPRKRPCVTPAALISTSHAEDGAWALACPGGDVIVQAPAQVLLNYTAGGRTVQQAVEAPRIAAFDFPSGFHPHPSAEKLVYAEEGIAVDARAALQSIGHHVTPWPGLEFDAGSVHMIADGVRPDDHRYWLAGADPRRSAYAITR